jgi:ABC-type multidrug transport system fused ATPase/permease subunit
MLSGGQLQRIAIARALIRKPEVLIFDESTSSLDPENEAIVQQAIETLACTHKMTIILIAHRMKTVRSAACIAVISGGRVIESGDHDTLIEIEDGVYRGMLNSGEG